MRQPHFGRLVEQDAALLHVWPAHHAGEDNGPTLFPPAQPCAGEIIPFMSDAYRIQGLMDASLNV